jgi:hypothetical protein
MPLRGRFGDTSGRPFLEGRLVLPRLNITTDVSFLVDAGADQCVLMPADGIRSGVDYVQLNSDQEIGGVGGTAHMFVEPGLVVFQEPGEGIHAYQVPILVAPPAPDLEKTPSLLGRAVLDRWCMVYDPASATLTFDVHSADATMPIAAP